MTAAPGAAGPDPAAAAGSLGIEDQRAALLEELVDVGERARIAPALDRHRVEQERDEQRLGA
jgi:hypothetical protein